MMAAIGIATLTINPALDLSMSVERVVPTHKLRCTDERRDPGGGGINVARVLRRFGVDAVAIYPAGGPTGEVLHRLVDRENVRSVVIPMAEETREDVAIFEKSSREQYRFVMPGPRLGRQTWNACLEAITTIEPKPEYLVASGSLPPGVPVDFYRRVAKLAKKLGTKTILDTSGAALAAALQEGVYVIKPSLSELKALCGKTLKKEKDWIAASRKFVDTGQTEIVALSLGDKGAIAVTKDVVLRAKAPRVRASMGSVGAGDSFLGAMVWRLAMGRDIEDALRFGVAAGAAALLVPGTELCHPKDVERLRSRVKIRKL